MHSPTNKSPTNENISNQLDEEGETSFYGEKLFQEKDYQSLVDCLISQYDPFSIYQQHSKKFSFKSRYLNLFRTKSREKPSNSQPSSGNAFGYQFSWAFELSKWGDSELDSEGGRSLPASTNQNGHDQLPIPVIILTWFHVQFLGRSKRYTPLRNTKKSYRRYRKMKLAEERVFLAYFL